MKPSENNTMNQTAKKAPAMFTVAQVEYYETLSRVSIRRLFPMRIRSDAREAIRGWIGTLRDAKRIRAYRNF